MPRLEPRHLQERKLPARHAQAPRDEVVEVLTQTRVSTLPVVDLDDRLHGAIRHESLVQEVATTRRLPRLRVSSWNNVPSARVCTWTGTS